METLIILGGSFAAGICVYMTIASLLGVAPKMRRTNKIVDDTPVGLQLWLIQSGSTLTASQFIAGSVVAGVFAFLIITIATGLPSVAFVPAAAAAFLPRLLLARERARKQAEVAKAWPEAIREITAAVNSGDSIHQAMMSLVRQGPESLRSSFARYPAIAKVSTPAYALVQLKEQQADPVTDRVIEVLLLAHERGGDALVPVLKELTEITVADLRTQREIKSLGTEQRLNIRATLVLPWVTLLLVCLGNADWRAFYQSSDGYVVVFIAAVWSALGLALATRLGKTESEPRVFTAEAEA